MSAAERQGERSSNPLGVLVAAGSAMFIVQLDFFSVNLALPQMSKDLGVSVTDLQWVVSGYMLAVASFMIPGGRVADIFGRRLLLIAGVAVFIFSSMVCGLVDSAGLIIGFRIVQGLGAAIVFPVAVAVVSTAFPAERQARALGNVFGIGAISTAIGPFIGGFFTEALSWRWIFLINIPLGAFTIAMVLRYVRESRDETVPRRIDFLGLATVALGIGMATFAIDRGEEWGWLSAPTIGVFLAGLALLALFVAVERRVRWPLVDLDLFRNHAYAIVTSLGAIANVAFCATTLATTIYLQQVLDYSPVQAGAIFLACSAMLGIAGPLAGRLGERFNVAQVIAVVTVIGSAGLVVVAIDPGLLLYVLGLGVVGIGFGIGWSIVNIGTQQVVPPEAAGMASGMTLAVVVGLGGAGVAVTSALIEAFSDAGTPQRGAVEGVLLGIAIGVAALALLLGWLDRRLERGEAGGAGEAPVTRRLA
jgi:EmrB/QacA subfamily drug resistance transporter